MAAHDDPKPFFITSKAATRLARVDLVIFDVDGVLVDAAESYPQAICDAVKWHFSALLATKDVSEDLSSAILRAITPHHVLLFKAAGGFNDEWDITYAMSLWVTWRLYRAWENRPPSSSSLEEFVDAVARLGGGLQAAEDLIRQWAGESWTKIASSCSQAAVTRIAQEFYGGSDGCRSLFGFSPDHVKGPGSHRLERDLVGPRELSPWQGRLGLYTGRNRQETQFALDRSGLSPLFPVSMRVTASDGLKKPDPEGLAVLCARVHSRVALFIGDTLDDLRTVSNFRARSRHCAQVFFAGVTGGSMGSKSYATFARYGADVIVRSARDLLSMLTPYSRPESGDSHEPTTFPAL